MSDPLDVIRAALPAGYTLEGVIASGGQGHVFLGQRSGVRVALKLFTAIEVERLRREVDLLSKRSCPHLVGLVDFQIIQISGQPVPMVVYEFVEGPNLREVIVSNRVAPESEVVSLGEHVGEAVEHLWNMRVVHRDIKPENIIASTSGHFVLVDVGFAQHLDLDTITAGGQPGTTGYRSPEQCGGRRRLTLHSDVFSLGVTLFEFAALEHPWQRNQAIMGVIAPRSLSELRSDFDPRICTLIHQMIRATPAQRPVDPSHKFRSLRRA